MRARLWLHARFFAAVWAMALAQRRGDLERAYELDDEAHALLDRLYPPEPTVH